MKCWALTTCDKPSFDFAPLWLIKPQKMLKWLNANSFKIRIHHIELTCINLVTESHICLFFFEPVVTTQSALPDALWKKRKKNLEL